MAGSGAAGFNVPRNTKMEAAGIEPTCEIDGTTEAICDCVNCEKCRAAPALHSGGFKSLPVSSVDADLLSIVLAWEKISGPIRKAILSLVESLR